MARSISVPFNAQRVLYVNLADFEDHHDLQDALGGFVQALCKRYPCMHPFRQWEGGEDLALAENDRALAGNDCAVVGISEYCGLGTVWVAPKRANRTCCKWVDSIKRDFILGAVREHLGQPLRLVAIASNGEAFF